MDKNIMDKIKRRRRKLSWLGIAFFIIIFALLMAPVLAKRASAMDCVKDGVMYPDVRYKLFNLTESFQEGDMGPLEDEINEWAAADNGKFLVETKVYGNVIVVIYSDIEPKPQSQ